MGNFFKWIVGADSLYGGNKKNKGGFEYQPYGGLRPPRIDSTGQEILRPTQKQDFDITMRRSLGDDVGYDPSWLNSSVALAKNELGRAKDDRLRENQGRLSASGLSGNPRAYEALAGRTQRDYSTDLENNLSRINIANMEASRADKNSATERLAGLNRFNFGQENSVADFDLDVYNSEQGNRLNAFNANQGVSRFDQNRSDENFSDFSRLALAGADLYGSSQGLPPGTVSASANALSSGGKGLSPDSISKTPSFYSQPLNSRNRRILTR